MKRWKVIITPDALRDLEDIYYYVRFTLLEPELPSACYPVSVRNFALWIIFQNDMGQCKMRRGKNTGCEN